MLLTPDELTTIRTLRDEGHHNPSFEVWVKNFFGQWILMNKDFRLSKLEATTVIHNIQETLGPDRVEMKYNGKVWNNLNMFSHARAED